MNLRDERRVGEQVKSGLRLAGFVLLTLALISWLISSTELLISKTLELPTGRQLHGRTLGALGMALLSVLMFFTARYWAKWFVGALAWMCIRVLGRGFILVHPPMSRMWVLEFLSLLICVFALSARYVMREPSKIEVLGLIGLLISLSFSLLSASMRPLLIGGALLALIQATEWTLRKMAGPDSEELEQVPK